MHIQRSRMKQTIQYHAFKQYVQLRWAAVEKQTIKQSNPMHFKWDTMGCGGIKIQSNKN